MKPQKERAFTLIELVMIIIVLGILSITAIARYFDIANEARVASEKGVVAGVIVGLHAYFSINKAFPDTLDTASAGASCSTSNPCFITILSMGGVTDPDWVKSDVNSYTGASGRVYTYSKDEGTFK